MIMEDLVRGDGSVELLVSVKRAASRKEKAGRRREAGETTAISASLSSSLPLSYKSFYWGTRFCIFRWVSFYASTLQLWCESHHSSWFLVPGSVLMVPGTVLMCLRVPCVYVSRSCQRAGVLTGGRCRFPSSRWRLPWPRPSQWPRPSHHPLTAQPIPGLPATTPLP